jgi:hypothetical protein
MLSHYISLLHRFLQSWMKLNKCVIETPGRSDISGPLSRFWRGWADMFSPDPNMSEFLKESTYRFTSQFLRFSSAAVNFLAGRPTVARPTRFKTESGHCSPHRRGFLRPPTRPRAPPNLSTQPSITRPFTTGFHPTAADFDPPGPASAPLSTGANGERRIHSVTELGRPNIIYMSNGSSGPIFTFLIQFEFYLTKRSRFEIFSLTMFLEFHLVFFTYFLYFLFFRNF